MDTFIRFPNSILLRGLESSSAVTTAVRGFKDKNLIFGCARLANVFVAIFRSGYREEV